MAGAKISALAAAADVAAEDLLAIVDDPSGTPATKKATVTQLATFLRSLAETLTNKTIALGSNTVTGTSAQLATAISDETGSGSLVFANTPTLVTPVIGAATGTSLAASSFLSVGATPATTGGIRLPNGGVSNVSAIWGKTTGGVDRLIVTLNDSDNVELGDGNQTAIVRGSAAGGVHLTATGSTLSFYSDRLVVPRTALPWITDSDGTSFYKFAVSNLAADRTVTLPLLTADDTFVFAAFSQTLANKTLTSPVISSISNTGTLTLPTATDTLVGRATTDTLTNKTINLTSNTLTFTSDQLLAACTDETGTGSLMFGTAPTMSSPTISTAATLSTSGMTMTANGNTKGIEYNKTPINTQTTTATTTTLDSFTLGSNTGVVVTWRVFALKSDVTDSAAWDVTAHYRNNAGTLTQVGTPTATALGTAHASWSVTVDNSGTTVRLRAVSTATTIQWTSMMTRLDTVP